MPTRTLSLALLLALPIVLANAAWSWLSWQDLRESGASRLLATSHTKRYVTNPGIEAWLVNLLERAGEQLEPRDQVVFEGLMKERQGDIAELPACMAHYAAQLLAAPPPDTRERARVREAPPPPSVRLERDPMRVVQHVEFGGHTLVLTRRSSLASHEPTLLPELEQAAAQLVALAEAWRHDDPPEWLTDRSLVESPPQLVRLFAVVEDGSVLTLPLDQGGRASLDDETAKLWRRLREPSVASIVVFEPHDFSLPREQNIHYTGIYPDKLGHGFVATLAVPGPHEPGRLKLLIAADLGLAVSHERLVAAADPSLALAVAELPSETRGLWQPWVSLLGALPGDSGRELLDVVHAHALRETQHEEWIEWSPLVFERTERGVLFATQLGKDHWLVGLARDPALPWPSMLLAPGLLLALLAGVELRTRRRERALAIRDAERRARDAALDELELLLVVDPHDDTVVHASAAARRELDVAPGQIVHERLVAADPRSQAHYRDQLAGGRRRSYGVRLRQGQPGTARYALIRSIPLHEPLPELHAATNHRLGLVYPIDHEADLALLLDDELSAARQDERNKLATILEHGVDLFARVLANLCAQPPSPAQLELAAHLADYLQARLHVTQWILDRWGGPSTREVECILGPEHLHALLEQYRRIFAHVHGDARLRARLHWNNGTLASPPPDDRIVEAWLDWPDEYRVTTPTEGLFGYFFGELLVNAIKHGTPGLPISVEVDVDRARRELVVRVRNSSSEPSDDARAQQAYGGTAILAEVARVCGWQLTRTHERDTIEVRWCCALTLQRPAGRAD